MPFSYDYFNNYLSELVRLLRPARVLDIGPGAGKYGKIVRERANAEGFATHISALEIDGEYITKFELPKIYDTIGHGDAYLLIKDPKVRYDLVIMGDVIEHMPKSRGIDLLNFLVYRTGYICVIYPHEFCQDDWEGHLAEVHISAWGPADFFGGTLHREWGNIRLALIKGYLPSLITITG
jgi:hypothetical protein